MRAHLLGARYRDAHEELEALWRLGGPGAELWKGLAQAYAALVHLQRGNLNGANRVLARARRTLATARPVEGLSTAGFERALATLAERLEAGEPIDPLQLPRGLD